MELWDEPPVGRQADVGLEVYRNGAGQPMISSEMNLRSARYARLGALAVLAVAATAAWGLDPQKAVAHYSQRIWNTTDGLPQDSVRAIAQTRDGYLWLGTQAGLARF